MSIREGAHCIGNRIESGVIGAIAAINELHIIARSGGDHHTPEKRVRRAGGLYCRRDADPKAWNVGSSSAVRLRSALLEDHRPFQYPLRRNDPDTGLYRIELFLSEYFVGQSCECL